jgi:hypothetical protein
MASDDTLKQLERDVQYLMDRQAILDCVTRHARGHDRHDVDIITSTYHQDGWDEHGHAINAGPEYAKWANEVHAKGSQINLHNITTHTCDIDGDTAHCESYVLVGLLNPDGVTARYLNGRYVDRLQKQDGEWRIAVRRSTVELAFTADASLLQSEGFKAGGYAKGTRDARDISYVRPLTIDTKAPELW